MANMAAAVTSQLNPALAQGIFKAVVARVPNAENTPVGKLDPQEQALFFQVAQDAIAKGALNNEAMSQLVARGALKQIPPETREKIQSYSTKVKWGFVALIITQLVIGILAVTGAAPAFAGWIFIATAAAEIFLGYHAYNRYHHYEKMIFPDPQPVSEPAPETEHA